MQILDLTMPLDSETPVYPGEPKAQFLEAATLATKGWNETRMQISSHFGTHIDAPSHMFADGKKLSDFPVSAFLGSAIVLELNAPLGLALVRKGDIVFLYTGHTDKMPGKEFFENNPVIPLPIATKLAEAGVRMVGIDSYSIDNPPFEIHKLLLRKNILIAENLMNLKTLVGKRFTAYALPLHLKSGDGAPCRAIAVL